MKAVACCAVAGCECRVSISNLAILIALEKYSQAHEYLWDECCKIGSLYGAPLERLGNSTDDSIDGRGREDGGRSMRRWDLILRPVEAGGGDDDRTVCGR